MSKLKIKTHTICTYETTDGREFEDQAEAREWQDHLENITGVVMLNSNFCNTARFDEAMYVHIKTEAQLKAFEALNAYEGLCARIAAIGYWYYDARTDAYISVNAEMDKLQSIIETLDVLGK
jgi:hypothetical protein